MIELKKILFRCDSSFNLGLGHVKRCLVLAKRLKEQNSDIEILFATLSLEGNINEEIVSKGYILEPLEDSSLEILDKKIKELEIDFLIIDSYSIDEVFEKELKQKNQKLKVLSFDDTFCLHYVDMLLNHGIQAKKSDYKNLVPPSCKVLCGSEYTLLRDEFFMEYQNSIEENSVAILLGGNDVLNLSSKVANALLEINSKYSVSIITSSVNPYIEELRQRADIKLLVDIDNIAEVLSSKEFVIVASGGSLFEVMALKKNFINIEVATNQKEVTNFLESNLIKTTIKADEFSLEKLRAKIEYIKKSDIYKKIELNFTKDRVAKMILEELV